MQSYSNKDLNQIFANAAVFTVLCESIRVFENRNNQVCEHSWGFTKRGKGVAAKTADPLALGCSPDHLRAPFVPAMATRLQVTWGVQALSQALPLMALLCIQFSSVQLLSHVQLFTTP